MRTLNNKLECDIFQIWEQYQQALYGYIHKRVTDEEDAKDILQDVLLKSYQFCTKGKEVLHLKSWLYRIAQNAIIDYHRKGNNRTALDFDIMEVSPEQNSIREASDYIKELLKLLPEDYARPLYMYEIEGLEQKTIAEELQLTLPNTKSRIQRARTKLKERFLECCDVSFDENGQMSRFDIKPYCKELQAEKERLSNESNIEN